MILDTVDYFSSKAWLDLVTSGDEELHVTGSFAVELSWSVANLLNIVRKPDELPGKPGIYIVYHGAKAHYVGISEKNLRNRFRNRLRVFREFDVNVKSLDFARILNNRSVIWATIKHLTGPRSGGVRQGRKNFKGAGQALSATSGVLKVLELHLIKALGTLRRGNIQREDVIFKSGGAINIKRITGSMRDRFPNNILAALDSSIHTDIRW